MKSLFNARRWRGWVWLGLGLAALGLAGCGTVEKDSQNASSRPWNSPKQWESGLPSIMTEGR